MITPESADRRLQVIAGHAAAGEFEQAEEQARILAQDLGRASRPVYPDFRSARSGRAPAWDANHQRYAAALPHVKTAQVRAAHADSAGTSESIEKARAALAPRQEATERGG